MFLEHDDFEQIEETKMLWRYVDLPRYIDMLIRKSLFFCRSDGFEDPFEGKYNKNSEKAFLQQSHIQPNPASDNLHQQLQHHYNKRTALVVNCWHQNDTENYAMWQIYAKGDFGIALQTTYKDLKQAFSNADESIFIGKVKYFDEAGESIAIQNNFRAFLTKRKIYAYENEVRCCHLLTDDFSKPYNWQPDDCNGTFIKVDLQQLIQRVYIYPNSPAWFRNVVEDINEKYAIHPEIIHSSVFESLHYI